MIEKKNAIGEINIIGLRYNCHQFKKSDVVGVVVVCEVDHALVCWFGVVADPEESCVPLLYTSLAGCRHVHRGLHIQVGEAKLRLVGKHTGNNRVKEIDEFSLYKSRQSR